MRLWDLEAPDYERLKSEYGRLRQTSLHQIVQDLESELLHPSPRPSITRPPPMLQRTSERDEDCRASVSASSVDAPSSSVKEGGLRSSHGQSSVLDALLERHATQPARAADEPGSPVGSPRTPLAEIRRRAYGDRRASPMARHPPPLSATVSFLPTPLSSLVFNSPAALSSFGREARRGSAGGESGVEG